MRLAMAYPFLRIFHQEMGLLDDDIEDLAQRAWREDAEPSAVLLSENGAWITWRMVNATLDRALHAKILAGSQTYLPTNHRVNNEEIPSLTP